jgi:hypothetical protein
VTRTYGALLAHQQRILGILRDLGLTTDEALAARLEELDERTDRTTLVGWRSGRTQAPLGLIGAILGHLAVEERCAWLSAALRPWDLQVRATATGDLKADLSAAQGEIGRCIVAVAESTAPSSPGGAELTAAEAAELAERFEALAVQASRVAADLRQRAGVRGMARAS